jgi:Zn-dependent membrane protease YugP
MFLWNSTYMLYMIPAFLLVMLAQLWVNSTYRKWSQVRNNEGITGLEAAQRLLRYGGLSNINIEDVRANLGDHYDPRSRTLRLSPGVAQGQSVASLAITAHEIGHALQDREEYFPLRFRAALVPAANVGSRLGFILIFIGLILGGVLGTQMAWVGVGAFALGAAFSLATLPVELNASSRARVLLTTSGLVQSEEQKRGVNAVLSAAAFTYIAALAAAILQLLYWVSLVGGSGGRRRR